MAERTIVFRADGGPTIGLGHFTRALALAQMLKEDFNCLFATRSPSKYQIDEIAKVCHGKIDLPDNETHFSVFLGLLKGDEIVVLDNYFYSANFQRSIKEKGCKLVCVDDLHGQEFYADIIINQIPGVTVSDYQAQGYTQFALGPDYALLRPAFLKTSQKARRIEHIETLFICFGGSDPFDLTKSTMEAVLNYTCLKRIIVVIGDMYLHKVRLFNHLARSPKAELYQSVDGERMAQLMNESDLAIIPSGGTLLEAMKIGIPVITGFYVENQKMASKYFGEAGLAIDCGNLRIDYQKKLNTVINSLDIKLLNEMISKQKTIFRDNRENYLELFKRLDQK
jgi:UDP-2,4-diacetamido-2,4,6-trideoxy-beta-L-altropyranose hydrolase